MQPIINLKVKKGDMNLLFIIEILEIMKENKWIVGLLGLLGPWIIFMTKSWIENFNNVPLEKKLNSNLTNFYKQVFLVIVTFISIFFFLLINSAEEIEEMIKNSSKTIVLLAFLTADTLITLVVIVNVKLASFLSKAKYEYLIIFDKKEELDWKLIKHSGKRGYLIRNEEGKIKFLKDIDSIQFKEVKIDGILDQKIAKLRNHRQNKMRAKLENRKQVED